MTIDTQQAYVGQWLVISDVPTRGTAANIVHVSDSEGKEADVAAYRDGNGIRVRLPSLAPGMVHISVDGNYVGELTVLS